MTHTRVPFEFVDRTPRALLVRGEDAHLRVSEVLHCGPGLARTVASRIEGLLSSRPRHHLRPRLTLCDVLRSVLSLALVAGDLDVLHVDRLGILRLLYLVIHVSHFLVAHLCWIFVEKLILLFDVQRRLLVSIINHVLGALLARLFILDKAVASGLVHGAEYLQLIVAYLSQSRVSAALIVRNSIKLLRFEAVS